MADIAPQLLQEVQTAFSENFRKNKRIASVYAKIRKGNATFKDAENFASETGKALSAAYGACISSDVLPDGKMYYNIAERVLGPTLAQNFALATKVAGMVQENLNEQANIGMKAVLPALVQDKVDGFLNRISSEDSFDDVKWILGAPVETFTQSAVDDTIRENAELQYKAGLRPKIVRTCTSRCCEWCEEIAGTYYYPDVPKYVFRRHNNCDCVVEYYPGDGHKQNVWSKSWSIAGKDDILNKQKLLRIPEAPASLVTQKVRSGQYSLKLSYQNYNKHVAGTADYRRYEASRALKGLNSQSRLSISIQQAQEIINKQSGTGLLKVRRDGTTTGVERITCDCIVGQYCHQGRWYNTNKAAIVHGKHGSHIYPIKGNDYD